MKATEFFKKVGIDAVKSYIAAYEDHLTNELKNLVNAYELVESYGGLEKSKLKVQGNRLGYKKTAELWKAIELVEGVNE